MVFFFYGPNTYAAKHKIRDMAVAYVAKAGSDFGLERLDGGSVSFETLGGALTAMPFLANSRLVIVDGLSGNKLVAEKVPALLAQVPETTVAVFYESNVDQRTTYFKAMSKTARAVKFESLSLSQLAAWTRREVANMGGSIDGPAVSWLTETVGEDQWRLTQEINKLVNYDPHITLENAKKLVVASTTQSIFDLVDAMSGRQAGRALTIFRGLLDERTNELYILTMITWQLRNLLLAKSSGMTNSAELAKQAGISPYVAGKALAAQRTMSQEYLKTAYLSAVEAEYNIKSGKGNPDQLVEQLIYQVAAA